MRTRRTLSTFRNDTDFDRRQTAPRHLRRQCGLRRRQDGHHHRTARALLKMTIDCESSTARRRPAKVGVHAGRKTSCRSAEQSGRRLAHDHDRRRPFKKNNDLTPLRRRTPTPERRSVHRHADVHSTSREAWTSTTSTSRRHHHGGAAMQIGPKDGDPSSLQPDRADPTNALLDAADAHQDGSSRVEDDASTMASIASVMRRLRPGIATRYSQPHLGQTAT